MSAAAKELLIAFNALPDPDQVAVVGELFLRRPIGEGDLPTAALENSAEELFLSYDAEEAADAATGR